MYFFFFFFKQKTAYEMRISDWSSDVCSSDLALSRAGRGIRLARLILQRQRGSEHIAEHRVGQSPGIRVVARAMIAIDEMAPVGQHMDGPMREGMNRERSEEHTSELQSLMRISYAVFCLKKKNTTNKNTP